MQRFQSEEAPLFDKVEAAAEEAKEHARVAELKSAEAVQVGTLSSCAHGCIMGG